MPEKKNWSERYLRSDHHTDRLVNTVVNYERASGLDFADPDQLYEEAMARGRPGSDRYYSRASVSRHRAASVPVGTGRDPNLSTFIKAQDISSGVMDDSDAISSASKWRDQQLLSNISHTLRSVGIHDTKPYPSYEPRPRPREQDCAPSLGYDPSRVGPRCRSVEPTNKKFGSGYDENQFKRNEKRLPSEIVEEAMKLLGGREERQRLASKSSSNIVDSIYSLAGARGSSSAALSPKVDETSEYVASILRSAEERARGNNDTITRVVSAMPSDYDNDSLYYNDDGSYDDYIPLTNRGLYRATYDDTSRYNDDDDEDDVEVVYIDGQGHSMLPSRAMYSGLSDAMKRELGVDDVGSSPYSYTDDSYAIEAPLASPIVVPTRVTSGRAYSRTAAPRRYSFSGSTGALSSAPSYSPSYNATPSISAAQNKITSIESQLELGSLHNEYTSAPVPYSALRSATVDARNKIDRHKTMLDRYLPINMGPENDVGYEVDYKIPQLEPYRPKTVAVSNSMVAPYRPVAKAGRDLCEAAKPPMASFRPEVSETRKRCREVLCKIKGDPRYYD